MAKIPRAVSPERQKEVDDILRMAPISIRLDTDLIEAFKSLAAIRGIGYQPLMREALHDYAKSESKRILAEYAAHQALKKSKRAAKVKEQP